MPVIKARTRGKQVVRHITRLDVENNEVLFAYARFLGEPTEYVLNQLVETYLAKDKDFLAWRAEHPESYVPPPASSSGQHLQARRGAGSGSRSAARRDMPSPAVTA